MPISGLVFAFKWLQERKKGFSFENCGKWIQVTSLQIGILVFPFVSNHLPPPRGNCVSRVSKACSKNLIPLIMNSQQALCPVGVSASGGGGDFFKTSFPLSASGSWFLITAQMQRGGQGVRWKLSSTIGPTLILQKPQTDSVL
jgi:hypothetical protein